MNFVILLWMNEISSLVVRNGRFITHWHCHHGFHCQAAYHHNKWRQRHVPMEENIRMLTVHSSRFGYGTFLQYKKPAFTKMLLKFDIPKYVFIFYSFVVIVLSFNLN